MYQTNAVTRVGFIIDRLGPRQTYAFGLVMVAIFGFVIGGMS